MKHIKTDAIILQRSNFGEADRIIRVITPTHGKVSLFARGARRPKSKLAGGLELFSSTNIVFIDGSSDLKTLISTRLTTFYSAIPQNLESTMFAYEAIKLIDKVTEESTEDDYYHLLNNVLASLNDHQEQMVVVQCWFYVQLLDISGSNINTDRQISGEKFIEEKKYEFNLDHMGFSAKKDGVYVANHIKFLRLLQKIDKPKNILHVANSKEYVLQLHPLLKQLVAEI